MAGKIKSGKGAALTSIILITLRGAAKHDRGSSASNGVQIQRSGRQKYHGEALGGGARAGTRRCTLLSGPQRGGEMEKV